MDTMRFRLTGNPSDLQAFVKELRADPALAGLEVTDPAPSMRDGERLGHVELVDVLISIGQGVASKVAYDAIKAAFERFKRGRRPMDLDELGSQERPDDG
jgi:hypothetical protein